MQTITLTPNPRREGRVDVLTDGELVGTIGPEAVVRLGVRSGAGITPEVLEAIRTEARLLVTYDRAVNMLAAKSRSTRELRLALLRKGEPAPLVDAALERLTALGHLDDARFARQFTRSRVVGGGFARRRVRGELARRGITSETAEEAIEEVLEDERVDQEAILLAAARKRLRTLDGADPLRRRRRLYAWLARRGFESDEILRVLDRVLEGEGDAGEQPAEARQPED